MASRYSKVVICTETYKQKADKREGGVGYEEHIISSELMNLNRSFSPDIHRTEVLS